MNFSNMNCISKRGCLSILYHKGPVLQAEMTEEGVLTFVMRDGRRTVIRDPLNLQPDSVYISQFGICITDDGKYCFVPSWYKGLLCFELETGVLIWRSKRKRAQEVVVCGNAVICSFCEQGVEKIDIHSGMVISRYSGSLLLDFFALSDQLYFVGPKNGKYHILNDELTIITTVSLTLLNPNRFENFLICQTHLTTEGIEISGFEHTDEQEMLRRAKREPVDIFRFSRIVSVDIPNDYI